MNRLRQLACDGNTLDATVRLPALPLLHGFSTSRNAIGDVGSLLKLPNLSLLFLGGNGRIPQSQVEALEQRGIDDFRAPDWKEG